MLPFPAVSVAAGHMKGTYMLPRGRVKVPQDLASEIFPWADGWLEFSKQVGPRLLLLCRTYTASSFTTD